MQFDDVYVATTLYRNKWRTYKIIDAAVLAGGPKAEDFKSTTLYYNGLDKRNS